MEPHAVRVSKAAIIIEPLVPRYVRVGKPYVVVDPPTSGSRRARKEPVIVPSSFKENIGVEVK